MKDTVQPINIALKARDAMSERLVGAIALSAPITMPTELKLANPHNA